MFGYNFVKILRFEMFSLFTHTHTHINEYNLGELYLQKWELVNSFCGKLKGKLVVGYNLHTKFSLSMRSGVSSNIIRYITKMGILIKFPMLT